jgi:hypothetical protein
MEELLVRSVVSSTLLWRAWKLLGVEGVAERLQKEKDAVQRGHS